MGTPVRSQYYHDYPDLVQRIKDAAAVHGFTGEYEADEIYWWTAPETAGEPNLVGAVYSDIVAAKYHARSAAERLRSHTFSLPDGGRLLALWADGAAVDDDPGIDAMASMSTMVLSRNLSSVSVLAAC